MIAPEARIAEVRTAYGRTIQEILSKEPNHDIYEILGAIEVLIGSKIYSKHPTSTAERMVFAFTWLAREVQNGGFHQFFINSAGDFWKDVLNGLKIIEDKDGLELFTRALSIFPNSSPSESRDNRFDQLDELEEQDEDKVYGHFRIVTEQYFKHPFPNWEMLFRYVQTHPHEFDLQNA